MFSMSICVITNNMGAIEQKRASFSEFEILTHALLDLNINLLANEMQELHPNNIGKLTK